MTANRAKKRVPVTGHLGSTSSRDVTLAVAGEVGVELNVARQSCLPSATSTTIDIKTQWKNSQTLFALMK